MRRIVVDTNVWVSTLLNPVGAPARVAALLAAERFHLVLSEPLLVELSDVLHRPRIVSRYGVTEVDIQDLIALLRARAIAVPVTGAARLCRDRDDDIVLETAMVGQAAALVSRDDDLKGDSELKRALAGVGIEILSVRQLLRRLEDERE